MGYSLYRQKGGLALNRKLTQLLQPSAQLYFLFLVLFALGTCAFSPYLGAGELVVVVLLGLYHQRRSQSRQKAIQKYLDNVTGNVELATKDTMTNETSRINAQNTFEELLRLGAVPVVNENDTVSTHEIQFGDNDRLSAIVAALIGADLLILMSDIDGLYSEDPHKNPDARFISLVEEITPELIGMGGGSRSDVGTGGMAAKLAAARIATDSGSDMIIANADDVNVIHDLVNGEEKGTLFLAHPNRDFDLMDYINTKYGDV